MNLIEVFIGIILISVFLILIFGVHLFVLSQKFIAMIKKKYPHIYETTLGLGKGPFGVNMQNGLGLIIYSYNNLDKDKEEILIWKKKIKSAFSRIIYLIVLVIILSLSIYILGKN